MITRIWFDKCLNAWETTALATSFSWYLLAQHPQYFERLRAEGYMLLLANGRAQTDLMFAALIVLAAFTVVLYFFIDRFGAWLTRRFAGPVG